jgi:hypothetical protein
MNYKINLVIDQLLFPIPFEKVTNYMWKLQKNISGSVAGTAGDQNQPLSPTFFSKCN